jgi:hypothetical protein
VVRATVPAALREIWQAAGGRDADWEDAVC